MNYFLLRTPSGQPEGPFSLFDLRRILKDRGTPNGPELVCEPDATQWEPLTDVVTRNWHIADPATIEPPTKLETLRQNTHYPQTRGLVWGVAWVGILIAWMTVLMASKQDGSSAGSLTVMAILSTAGSLIGAQIVTALFDIADAQLAHLPETKLGSR